MQRSATRHRTSSQQEYIVNCFDTHIMQTAVLTTRTSLARANTIFWIVHIKHSISGSQFFFFGGGSTHFSTTIKGKTLYCIFNTGEEESGLCIIVPAGSPSRVGDFAVCVFDINQPSLPTPFYSVLLSVSVWWPFQLYFIPEILPTTLSLSQSVLLVFFLPLIGPFNYISLYESLCQPCYNPLWLTGLKAPTN